MARAVRWIHCFMNVNVFLTITDTTVNYVTQSNFDILLFYFELEIV